MRPYVLRGTYLSSKEMDQLPFGKIPQGGLTGEHYLKHAEFTTTIPSSNAALDQVPKSIQESKQLIALIILRQGHIYQNFLYIVPIILLIWRIKMFTNRKRIL